MKLIAIIILLAVVVLVVVGYDLLVKLAQKEDKHVKDLQNETWKSYYENQGKNFDEVVKAAADHLEKQNKHVVDAVKERIENQSNEKTEDNNSNTTKTN